MLTLPVLEPHLEEEGNGASPGLKSAVVTGSSTDHRQILAVPLKSSI